MKNDDEASGEINDGSDLVYNKTDILHEGEWEEDPLPEHGHSRETKLKDVAPV